MFGKSTQPEPRFPSDRGSKRQRSRSGDQRAASKAVSYAVALLLVLIVSALCVIGFIVIRALFSDSPPPTLPASITRTDEPTSVGSGAEVTSTATVPTGAVQITVDPAAGTINALVRVSGQGWWPEEPVFVFLRSPEEGDGPGYAYAAAVADEAGSFHSAFTFPNEARWIGQDRAYVIARGNRSGLEASTQFSLVAPTATNTAHPPTPRPTLPPGQTPKPTETPLPTDTPQPSPTPTSTVIITDWLGEYFANPYMAGTPVFFRNDVRIDFNWGGGSPDPHIPVDQFSARWTRRQEFAAGYYRFTVQADDGVRLWIDGQLVLDEWHDSTLAQYSFDQYLSQGQHPLRLEYYENLGGALVRLSWQPIAAPTATPSATLPPTSTPTQTTTPSPTPTPTSTPTATGSPTPTPTATSTPPTTSPLPAQWAAAYYANPDLTEPAALARMDAAVDFNWGEGSPGEGIPADGFSARWTGDVMLPAGSYAYTLAVDDGGRVWVDGQLVVDEWHASGGAIYPFQVVLQGGLHTFVVEYLEVSGSASIRLAGAAPPAPQPAVQSPAP